VARRHAGSESEASALAAYLREIAKAPRLTVEEERHLGLRIERDRDEWAMARLVESHLRFVVRYAKRHRGLGVSFLDLIHEGNLGLIEAARRFTGSRRVRFISDAAWWIRQAMMHALSDKKRAPVVPPTVGMALPHGVDAVSLGAPADLDLFGEMGDLLGRDGGRAVPDEPVGEDVIPQADLDDLADALLALDGKERRVVRLRFGLERGAPRTLQEIGDRLHLSRERIQPTGWRVGRHVRRAATLQSDLN
jgi:RNA polymerase primary sigma factor